MSSATAGHEGCDMTEENRLTHTTAMSSARLELVHFLALVFTGFEVQVVLLQNGVDAHQRLF